MDSVRDFLHHDMDRDLYVYLQEIFTAIPYRTAVFRSATGNTVD